MSEKDLILDAGCTPDFDEIDRYIGMPERELWRQLNLFIQERYKASPKIMYSCCTAKPGWNVKYQKSGKSICTLYPEREGFVALVVVTLDLLPIIEALSEDFASEIARVVKSVKPFNGTAWLMLRVDGSKALDNVKQILLIKLEGKK